MEMKNCKSKQWFRNAYNNEKLILKWQKAAKIGILLDSKPNGSKPQYATVKGANESLDI